MTSNLTLSRRLKLDHELPAAVRHLEPGQTYTETTTGPDGATAIAAVWVKKSTGGRRHSPTPDPLAVALAAPRSRLLAVFLVIALIAGVAGGVLLDSPLQGLLTALAWGVAPPLILRHFAKRDLQERELVIARAERELAGRTR